LTAEPSDQAHKTPSFPSSGRPMRPPARAADPRQPDPEKTGPITDRERVDGGRACRSASSAPRRPRGGRRRAARAADRATARPKESIAQEKGAPSGSGFGQALGGRAVHSFSSGGTSRNSQPDGAWTRVRGASVKCHPAACGLGVGMVPRCSQASSPWRYPRSAGDGTGTAAELTIGQ
jgi:hypothetical protein